MREAAGIVEVYGLVAAFAAADAGCKAGNVTLDDFDKNKPAGSDASQVPLIVTVKFRGSVSDVEAAVEAAVRKANEVSGVVVSHIIARPEAGTEKMLEINGLDKD